MNIEDLVKGIEPIIPNLHENAVADLPFGRYNTLQATLGRIQYKSLILEFGTAHQANGKHGDGWSTVAFARHVDAHNGMLITIDSNPDAITFSKELTKLHATQIDYVCADIFDFFNKFNVNTTGFNQIDLLYLDGWRDSKHYDRLWKKISKKTPVKMVLIDDTHRPGFIFSGAKGRDTADSSSLVRGKGRLLIPILLEAGYEIVFFEQGQILFQKEG